MPTGTEREYYAAGFRDGMRAALDQPTDFTRKMIHLGDKALGLPSSPYDEKPRRKPKRKLSAWNKFVKANSRKKEFRYRDGKLNLKKMGVAFRRKKRR
jgi:hypothetical protein